MITNREKITEIIKEFEEQKNNGLKPGSYLCCAEIGREFSITRQWVHQIIGELGWPTIPEGLLNAKEAGRELGYHHDSLIGLVKSGKLYGVKIGSRCYYDVASFNIGTCRECGLPVPKGRHEHCSAICLEIAQAKSRAKSNWRRFLRKWEAEHTIA